MLFNTLDFLVFGTLVYCAYLLLPAARRRLVLLPASLFFYGYWNVRILVLLVATVAVNYVAARLIERARQREAQVWWPLFVAVATNLGFLGYFKYYNFFATSLNRLLEPFGFATQLPIWDILLPVGISFYTFQITAYVVDVARGQVAAERNFGNLLLFTTYFPQLVAGPIERAGHLLPLLRRETTVSGHQISSGATLAAWGLFKKVFVADNLSQFVDILLVPGTHPPTFAYSLGACVFALQIYADFSGYTDTARGLSRMLGIELTLNFNLPFLASNPADFWRRWHITLGAFLRDYLYIPLGGNRHGFARHNINIVLVWTAGGLWHGASLGFLVWGIYCGFLVVLYNVCRPVIAVLAQRGAFYSLVLRYGGRAFTFLTFAHGLLLFRVENVQHLQAVFTNLLPNPAVGSLAPSMVGHLLFYAWPLLAMQALQAFRGKLEVWAEWPAPLRALLYFVGLVLFVVFGVFNADQFFYFQF